MLRDYQLQAVEDLRRAAAAGHRRIVLVAGTGTGKTTIAAEVIRRAVAKDRNVIFLAHRKELVDQCSERLVGVGVPHGVIMADRGGERQDSPVYVASIQTLVRRDLLRVPDVIFIDEAHRARADTYQEILDRFPLAVTIGLTATPVRSDGKGLGNLFTSMIQCPGVASMISAGHLVPVRTFAPSRPDLRGVKKIGGDYDTSAIESIMNRPGIVGDIVENWKKHGQGRPTIAFCVSILHSKAVTLSLQAAGVAAEHIDGMLDWTERERVLRWIASGGNRVLCSVGVLTEGWDCPPVSCAILARPTASVGLYLQMAGRILRPYPGKTDALIFDHAGNALKHGLVGVDREWLLTTDRKVISGNGLVDPESKLRVCPECSAVYDSPIDVCECGYRFATSPRALPAHLPGELEEITAPDLYIGIPVDRRKKLYEKWQDEARERKYKSGYANAKWWAMFKCPPPRMTSLADLRPSEY